MVDEAGYPLAVHARVAGQSLFGATRKSWLEHTPEGDWDESMVDGIYNQSYRLPHFLVETVDTPLPVPVYFMRSVGSTAAVFFWESMITELAHRARRSTSTPIGAISCPTIRWRCACSTPRRRRRAGGRARPTRSAASPTIATSAAAAASKPTSRRWWSCERVADRFAVKRVFCAVDPGLAVNPNTLRAQIEGGIGFAMTTALKSKITFSNGGTDQSNFFDYPLLSIDEMPEIVPIVLAERSSAAGRGRGRAGAASLPRSRRPLLHATGRRLDVMPFPDDAFKVAGADPARRPRASERET